MTPDRRQEIGALPGIAAAAVPATVRPTRAAPDLRTEALRIAAGWQRRRFAHGAPTLTAFLDRRGAEREYQALRQLTPVGVGTLLNAAVDLLCAVVEGGWLLLDPGAIGGSPPATWDDLAPRQFAARTVKHTAPTTAELRHRLRSLAASHGLPQSVVVEAAVGLLYAAVTGTDHLPPILQRPRPVDPRDGQVHQADSIKMPPGVPSGGSPGPESPASP